MLAGRRLYVAITGVYLLSRLLLGLLGVRFHADYLWQHFHDPDLLTDRLWETLVYTHAFTPFINLFAGLVLKTSSTHAVAIYQSIFFALGWTLTVCLAYLLVVFRLRAWAVLVLVTLFSCSPAFIYFENFLHYELMAAALLAVAAVLFHRALVDGSWRRWTLFFLTCALIAYVRTTFHLVWLVFLVGMAVLFQRARWRTILTASVLPILLVAALYAKNKALFGFFGSSSMFGFNLAYMTTKPMTPTERQEWVDRGLFHPVARVGLFEPPAAYAAYVDLSKQTGIPVLDRQLRRNGQPNFNHWAYADLSKLRMADNRTFIDRRPGRYLETVRQGWVDYFRPSTRWHPHDPAGSPHQANRQVIGGWENLYNSVFHTLPWPPFGLYLPMLLGLGYASWRSLRALWQRRLADSAAEKLVLFLAFNCFYVPALSCLVTIGELERYRFMVESFHWVLAVAALQLLLEHWRRRAPRRPPVAAVDFRATGPVISPTSGGRHRHMTTLRAAFITMTLATCLLLPACGLAPEDDELGGLDPEPPEEGEGPTEDGDWLVGPPITTEGQSLVAGGSPITQGWRQQPFHFRVQRPYDKNVSERYSFHPPGEHRLFVLASDKAHQPGNKTDPRTEMRWREEYTAGQHMFEADVFIVPGADNSSVVQIKRLDAPTGPATALMLVVHADGHIRYYRNNRSEPVIRNAFNRWFNLKVAHDASSGRIRIFENDRQLAVKLGNRSVNELDDRTASGDRGKVRFHFKNGPYGVTSRSEIRYRNIRSWTR